MSVPEYRKYLYLKLWFLLFVFGFQQGYAQRVSFRNFNPRNGLAGSEVNCLLQDKRGYLWIGTKNGLSRYDGAGFQSYTTRNGLPSPVINALAADRQGNILIATSKGICSFDGAHFTTLLPPSGADNATNDVKNIVADPSGKIWFCTAAGTVQYIENKKAGFLKLQDTGVLATAIYRTGTELIVAGSNGFIYSYNPAGKKWSSKVTELMSNENVVVKSIYKGSGGKTWFVTNAGLFVKTGDAAIPYKLKSGSSIDLPAEPACMTEDVLHNYWVGTATGALRFNDSSVQYYNQSNGFTDAAVKSILTDAEGNIWFGSGGNGLFRFSGSVFSVIDQSTGLPGNNITALALSRNGLMFLGSSDGGLFQYQNGASSPLAMPAGIKPAVSALAVRGGYQLWMGTKGNGLWRYDYRGFKQYIAPTGGIPSNYVNTVFSDSRGRVWIGYDQGLVMNEKDTFRRTGIRNVAVYSIFELSPDSILFATSQGIKIARDSSYYPFITGTAVDSVPVRCFAKKDNELWLGTAGEGIVIWNRESQSAKSVTKPDGLLSDMVVALAVDKDGAVWAGTDAGLHKITNNDAGNILIQSFGEKQGITPAACNPNAVLTLRDGSLWFGTSNGALHYSPGANMVQSMPISIVLQKVLLFGQAPNPHYYNSYDSWQGIPRYLHLPAEKNNIGFRFQGISLSASESLKYRYRLEGINDPWSAWSYDHTVAYPALPYGNYTLVIQCTAGGKDIKELRYSFDIATPYYNTLWFRALLIAGFVLSGVVIHFLYTRRREYLQREVAEQHIKAVAAIKERTSGDYHKITTDKINKISAAAATLLNVEDIDKAKELALQIKQESKMLSENTEDMLWLLKPGNNNLQKIIQHISETGRDILSDTHIGFEFESEDRRLKNFTLPIDVSLNLIIIFKEAFLNISKHSDATAATLVITLKNRKVLQLKLNDNGKSFDMQYVRKGQGLSAISKRAAAINARVYIDAMPDKGTIITLTLRIPEVV